MTPLPLTDLLFHDSPQLGLLLAVVVGFGFGFVLERAGFGRATKLAAQFYGTDMTVLKVMFGAIVTAALGLVVFDGLGWIELGALSRGAASWTYVWPMLVGGLLLGVGFIVSGYCPGTSAVSAASGNIDGMVTLAGVGIGCLVFAEGYPLLSEFMVSGSREHWFLYELLHLPPAVVAAGIAVMAMGAFLAAEIAERRFGPEPDGDAAAAPPSKLPRHIAFATFGLGAVAGLVLLAVPGPDDGAGERAARDRELIGQQELAARVVQEPWTLRILDLRDREACAGQRIPGAECTPLDTLGDLGLAYAPGVQDLVLVGDRTVEQLPAAAAAYPGDVVVLDGGFRGWEWFALTEPSPPDAPADSPLWAEYHFRSGLYSAMTGAVQAPPPAAPATTFVPEKREGGGGCS